MKDRKVAVQKALPTAHQPSCPGGVGGCEAGNGQVEVWLHGPPVTSLGEMRSPTLETRAQSQKCRPGVWSP